MNQFFQTREFRASQIVRAKVTLVDAKGEVYLHEGQEARIMMCDPEKYPDRPYGLRKADEHVTRNFFAAEQLEAHPEHPAKVSVWEANPAERYSHPSHSRHEELRACGWRVDPATIGM